MSMNKQQRYAIWHFLKLTGNMGNPCQGSHMSQLDPTTFKCWLIMIDQRQVTNQALPSRDGSTFGVSPNLVWGWWELKKLIFYQHFLSIDISPNYKQNCFKLCLHVVHCQCEGTVS